MKLTHLNYLPVGEYHKVIIIGNNYDNTIYVPKKSNNDPAKEVEDFLDSSNTSNYNAFCFEHLDGFVISRNLLEQCSVEGYDFEVI